jgi:hypothetical protein
MPHGISRALRIRVLAEIGLEVVFENGLQSRADFFPGQWSLDSVASRHPRADNSV